MKNKKLLIIIGTLVLFGLVVWYLSDEDVGHQGRLYPSKVKMCLEFASSYLRTIQKTDNITDFGGDKWNMAVDIETEMYDLCMLDLNEEALKNYRPTALEKYQSR